MSRVAQITAWSFLVGYVLKVLSGMVGLISKGPKSWFKPGMPSQLFAVHHLMILPCDDVTASCVWLLDGAAGGGGGGGMCASDASGGVCNGAGGGDGVCGGAGSAGGVCVMVLVVCAVITALFLFRGNPSTIVWKMELPFGIVLCMFQWRIQGGGVMLWWGSGAVVGEWSCGGGVVLWWGSGAVVGEWCCGEACLIL